MKLKTISATGSVWSEIAYSFEGRIVDGALVGKQSALLAVCDASDLDDTLWCCAAML